MLAEQMGAQSEHARATEARGGSLGPGDGVVQGQCHRMRGGEPVSMPRGVFLPKPSALSLRKAKQN